MILTIILSLLLIIGRIIKYIGITKDNLNKRIVGSIIMFISGLLLLTHLMMWTTTEHRYEQFLTLKQEVYAIEDIQDRLDKAKIWNDMLSTYQYLNNNVFLKMYIDDRVNRTVPINYHEIWGW